MKGFQIKDPLIHARSGVTRTTLEISKADDISIQMITQVKNKTNQNMIWTRGNIWIKSSSSILYVYLLLEASINKLPTH